MNLEETVNSLNINKSDPINIRVNHTRKVSNSDTDSDKEDNKVIEEEAKQVEVPSSTKHEIIRKLKEKEAMEQMAASRIRREKIRQLEREKLAQVEKDLENLKRDERLRLQADEMLLANTLRERKEKEKKEEEVKKTKFEQEKNYVFGRVMTSREDKVKKSMMQTRLSMERMQSRVVKK